MDKVISGRRRLERAGIALLAIVAWLATGPAFLASMHPAPRRTISPNIHAGEILRGWTCDGRAFLTGGLPWGLDYFPCTLWDAASGTRQAVLQEFPEQFDIMEFSADGKIVLLIGSGMVKACDGFTGDVLYTIYEYGRPTVSPAFSPEGEGLAIVTQEGDVGVWNVRTGGERGRLPCNDISELRFSPDAHLLAVARYRSNLVEVYDTTTMKKRYTISVPDPPPDPNSGAVEHRIRFSPDGQTLALASRSTNAVLLVDAESGDLRCTLRLEVQTGASFLAFSPCAPLLITQGRDISESWDTITGQRITTWREEGCWTEPLFSRDGKVVAIESGFGKRQGVFWRDWIGAKWADRFFPAADYGTLFFDPNTGEERWRLAACSVRAFLPDGKSFVTFDPLHAEHIQFWDLPPRTLVPRAVAWLTLCVAVGLSFTWWLRRPRRGEGLTVSVSVPFAQV